MKEKIVWNDETSYQDIFDGSEELKESELDIGEPFPNEHSCRLVNPDTLKTQGFTRVRRTDFEIDGKKAQRILFFKGGRQSGEGRTQAVRFNKDSWTPEQASKWCRAHDGSFEKASELLEVIPIQELISETKIEESFAWIPDIERVRMVSRKGPGKFFKIVALHPIMTDRQNEGHGSRKFGSEEAKKAARTLAQKEPNLLHKIKLVHGHNTVFDAEYENDRIEALVYLEDPEMIQGIRDEIIDKVSVQGNARKQTEHCHDGKCADEPEGIIFNGLAFVNSLRPFTYNGTTYPSAPPGDVRTKIEIIETNTRSGASPNSNSSLTIEFAKQSQMELSESAIKSMVETYGKAFGENLQNVMDAINKTDAPPEFKMKLIDMAKQMYANQAGGGNGETGGTGTTSTTSTTEGKTLENKEYENRMKQLEDDMGEIKKVLGEIKEGQDKKNEELFNKVVDEKIEAIKKDLKEAKDKQVNEKTKTLETLTKDQTAAALQEKLKTVALQEIMGKYTEKAA